MHRLFWALGVLVMLGACSVESVSSSPEEVARAIYRHNGPTRLTLFTTIYNPSKSGSHTALMVNGSQRVIYDPAGTFKHDKVAEQNDVLFGITPIVEQSYKQYHANGDYHLQMQEFTIPPQVAEIVIRRMREQGAVPGGKCTQSTSAILAGVPGFESITQTYYPKKLAEQMSKITGVRYNTAYEYVDADGRKVLRTWTGVAR